MSTERQQLLAAISGIESQRAALGDAVVDAALAPLRARLATLVATPADAAATTEPRLKQVTVLFLDFVGSTRLSQHLDPEEIHAVMDDALARCTAIVAAHHGKVLQYAGDSLLAVFGADIAHEDDPERAVRAGLALLEEGLRQGELVKQRHGRDGLDVRVGVHTGGVLLGAGIEAQSSIRGMAVNIAARMEQTAPAGALRISQQTYRHVRGAFDVEAQPPLQVKGSDEAMLTYLVHRTKPAFERASGRGVDGVDVRMVGRDLELTRLCALFDQAARARALTLAALVGDAGLGKSRLLSEVQHRLEARSSWIVRGQAQVHGITQPYGVLRDMLCRRCQIQDGDSDELAQRKLRAVVGAALGARAEEWCALIGQLIGLDLGANRHVASILHDGKQIRDRAFHALARYFAALCGDGPGVLLLDDLHWGDEGSLDFIAFLAHQCHDRPMLLVCATRPALYERHPRWVCASEPCQRIDLLPLTAHSSLELADVLLQRIRNPPAALHRLLVAGAEGNPFYMEELTQVLIDDGVISTGSDAWTVAAPDGLPELRVPSTLTGVLQARLDALPRPEKEALQRASVIGSRFWQDALEQLLPGAAEALPALLRKDLVRTRFDGSFAGTREYEFKHHLLHQVAYDGVLKRHRRDWHRTTAEWLLARSGGRAGESLALIAMHFGRAGDDGRAATYWGRAAEDALARFATEVALAHADHALQHLADTDLSGRYAMVRVREGVHSRRADRDTQAQTLAELERLADQEGDDLKRCWVAIRRAGFEQRGGDYAQALVLSERALALVSPQAPVLGARAHEIVATTLTRLKRHDEARQHAQAGLALARAAGDKVVEASLLNNMAMVRAESGDVSGAVALFGQALDLLRAVGDLFSVAIALSNRSDMSRSLGDFVGARSQALEAIELARETGNRQIEGYAQLNLALMVLNLGEPQAALDHALEALAILREIGDRWAESGALTNAGHAELALGHWEAAGQHYAAACELCDALDMGHLAMVAMGGLADVALATGDAAAARRQVHAVLERLAAGATLDSVEEPLRLRLTCYRVLAADQDPRAADMLSCAHAELQGLAAAVADPQARRALLQDVPHHRQIMQAWERAQANPSVR